VANKVRPGAGVNAAKNRNDINERLGRDQNNNKRGERREIDRGELMESQGKIFVRHEKSRN